MNNRTSLVRDLAYVAVFAALIIALAFVAIPVGAGVPIVLQNAAIILAGLVLGAKRGLAATALFLLLGLIGLPVLAGGRTTLAALGGTTVGYLVGYLVAAFVAGLCAYSVVARKSRGGLIGMLILGSVLGLIAMYVFGAIGLVFRTDMNLSAALLFQGTFVLPDAVKIAAAVVIALGVHSAFPQLRRSPSQATTTTTAAVSASS